MKFNLRLLTGAAALAGTIAIAATASTSMAQADQAARIEQGVGCFMNLPSVVNTVLNTDQTIDVSTHGGTTSLTCHFDIPDGFAPDKATSAEGFGCGVLTKDGFAVTTDSKATANPGGKALLVCKIKNK